VLDYEGDVVSFDITHAKFFYNIYEVKNEKTLSAIASTFVDFLYLDCEQVKQNSNYEKFCLRLLCDEDKIKCYDKNKATFYKYLVLAMCKDVDAYDKDLSRRLNLLDNEVIRKNILSALECPSKEFTYLVEKISCNLKDLYEEIIYNKIDSYDKNIEYKTVADCYVSIMYDIEYRQEDADKWGSDKYAEYMSDLYVHGDYCSTHLMQHAYIYRTFLVNKTNPKDIKLLELEKKAFEICNVSLRNVKDYLNN
jgi:hypothetical protein